MKRMNLIKLLTLFVFILTVSILIGCSDDDDDENINNAPVTTADVNGTLTLPAVAIGQTYVVMIDGDTNGDNGEVKNTVGLCGNSTTVDYTINDVPSGTYYVYAVVYVVSSTGPLTTGDYLGFYGTGASAPGSPNATVPTSGSVTLDITLSVY
jgi:hypothetical protein